MLTSYHLVSYLLTKVLPKIYDGSQAKSPTFHGSLASKDYAQQHPEVIKAYLQATIEANRLIQEQPEKYSELIAENRYSCRSCLSISWPFRPANS